MPDIPLPKNLVATPKLKDVVKDATLLVFVTPHQFLHTVLKELSAPGVVIPGARAITAIKGVEVDGTDIGTFAELIESKLGTPCSALSGANIALEGEQCRGPSVRAMVDHHSCKRAILRDDNWCSG